MKKSLLKLALTTTSVALSLAVMEAKQAQAIELVNDSFQGYYNSSLGDLYPGSPADPLASYFPGPNVSTGDPFSSFGVAPDLSGVTNLGNWLSNPATALSNGFWNGLQTIPSTWNINYETAIIYEIDGGDYGVSNLIGNFGVDNGIFVWVNGEYKFGATAPGYALAYEYSNINLGSLNPGKNYIQILRADHGGATGYTTSISGDYNSKPTSVPEPSLLLSLLAISSFGAASAMKKKLAFKA